MGKESSSLSHIKAKLEKAGFKTSRRRPFWEWMHPEWKGNNDVEQHDGNTLYVSSVPVPKVAPVDFAEVEIGIDDDRLYFCFTLYFYTVLRGSLETEEFRKIHEQHDLEWHPKLRERFLDASLRFGLEWDVEFDESIEDSLYGNFSTDETDTIIEAVQALSGQYAGHEAK